MRLRVVLHEVAHDAVNLQRQLARGGDDQRAGAVAGGKLGAVQELDARDQESKCLARPWMD